MPDDKATERWEYALPEQWATPATGSTPPDELRQKRDLCSTCGGLKNHPPLLVWYEEENAEIPCPQTWHTKALKPCGHPVDMLCIHELTQEAGSDETWRGIGDIPTGGEPAPSEQKVQSRASNSGAVDTTPPLSNEPVGTTAQTARQWCDENRHHPKIGKYIQALQSWAPDSLARVVAEIWQSQGRVAAQMAEALTLIKKEFEDHDLGGECWIACQAALAAYHESCQPQ